MVALLGILKTGAAYLPLDPSYPQQRLGFMLKDAGVQTLVTDGRWAEALPTDELTVVHLGQEKERLALESSQNLCVPMSPDNVAYVIYTSGSTGQPKGVLGLHLGAVNRFAWMWNAYPSESGEVACAKTALNFVDSVWELFGPLLAGIPTLMISDEVVKSPQKLIATLAKHRVTRLVLVPSLLRALLEREPEIASRLPALKYWICSGEAIGSDLVRSFCEVAPGRILLNLYGSSEVSADVTCCDIRELGTDESISIGRPIANTQTYIVDKNLQPMPVGVVGQLCVGGEGLARGYLNRPLQSVSKFVNNPFSKDPKARMYLTGDLARYRPDGKIQLMGRIDGDHQVKIRGFRIEPGEIESLLQEHPSVTQAVVISRNGPAGEPCLGAYILQKESADIADLVAHLRSYLRERLPEYMIPAMFQVLPAFPLLPNGKVDRDLLTKLHPTEVRVHKAETFTTTEARIHQIWQEVLLVDQISTDDNFFDAGGHSLLLAAVQTRLESAFHREIASVDLYRYPTIRALAKRLDDSNVEQRSLQTVWDRARMQKDSLVRRRAIAAARPK
jgi:amino acid adenylation domain-containing protein